MCEFCSRGFDDREVIEMIRENDLPNDSYTCDFGWREISKVWGKYGYYRKELDKWEWKVVCETRAMFLSKGF